MNQEAVTMVCPFSFTRSRAGSKKIGQKKESAPGPVTEGRIPRVSRLMALTIKLENDLQSGKLRDYSDVARLGRITRARATQIMNLQHLAPDIQEAVLFLPRTFAGRDAITEHDLRAVAATPVWDEQRRLWASMLRVGIP